VRKRFDKFSWMKKYCKGKLKELNEHSGITYGGNWSNVFCYFKEEEYKM
jgi:hypothetical protein